MVTLEGRTIIRAPIERCFDLARSVEVHLAGNVHSGESAVAAAGVTSGLIGLGQRVTWRAKHFGVWHSLTSEITALDPPVYFQDTMIRGIFRSMRHDHFFRARHFHRQGHTVTVLSRSPRPAPWRIVPWDGVTPGSWIADLERSDVCINLAGRSVNCRYTPANRRAILDSRVLSTRLLNEVIAVLPRAPRLWINASTATIYRHALDRPM